MDWIVAIRSWDIASVGMKLSPSFPDSPSVLIFTAQIVTKHRLDTDDSERPA